MPARRDQLGFDLTVMGKLLVIAAFIASCNPEGADKRLFGSAKGSRKRTRNLAGTDKVRKHEGSRKRTRR